MTDETLRKLVEEIVVPDVAEICRRRAAQDGQVPIALEVVRELRFDAAAARVRAEALGASLISPATDADAQPAADRKLGRKVGGV